MTNECHELAILNTQLAGVCSLMVEYQTVTLVVVGSSPITHPIFWNLLINNPIKSNSISFCHLKKKMSTWYTNWKIRTLLKKYNKINDKNDQLISKFYKNKKYSIFFKKMKLNYIEILFNKHCKYVTKCGVGVFFYVMLNKKQTYINVHFDEIKKIHITNGIVLKGKGISEKSRKKDQKTSILTVSKSLELYQKEIDDNGGDTKNNNITINIKKIKPFINKVSKMIFDGVKSSGGKISVIITPQISFGCDEFKKIKSIKRRLRKKYIIIDF